MRPCVRGACEAGVGRREVRTIGHLRAAQRRFRHPRRSAIDSLPIHKSVARSCSNGARLMRIPVVEIVVVVQDVDVGDPRICDIHIAEVISARVVPRMERLAEP
jgi:hypothetical protein